jgi:hypothetical protein
MLGLVALLAQGCEWQAATFPAEETGPARPAACDRPALRDVCFELEQLASTEIELRHAPSDSLMDDDPLGELRVGDDGRLRFELAFTAEEDAESVRGSLLLFLTGAAGDWKRAQPAPPHDLRLTSARRYFETDYEILIDLTPRGRRTRIDAVVATVLPVDAIEGRRR